MDGWIDSDIFNLPFQVISFNLVSWNFRHVVSMSNDACTFVTLGCVWFVGICYYVINV